MTVYIRVRVTATHHKCLSFSSLFCFSGVNGLWFLIYFDSNAQDYLLKNPSSSQATRGQWTLKKQDTVVLKLGKISATYCLNLRP